MALYTYILKCADGRHYTAHTEDLEVRLAQHRSSHFPGFTSKHLPVELVWTTNFPTRDEAFTAKIIIKKWSRAKKEAMKRGDWDAVSFFARPPSEGGNNVSTSLDTSGLRHSSISSPLTSIAIEILTGKLCPTDPEQNQGHAHIERSRDTPQ